MDEQVFFQVSSCHVLISTHITHGCCCIKSHFHFYLPQSIHVILQVTLHCNFLSTYYIFCHIGVQKDVLCLPNSLARLRICLGGYGGVDGAEACALHADHPYRGHHLYHRLHHCHLIEQR